MAGTWHPYKLLQLSAPSCWPSRPEFNFKLVNDLNLSLNTLGYEKLVLCIYCCSHGPCLQDNAEHYLRSNLSVWCRTLAKGNIVCCCSNFLKEISLVMVMSAPLSRCHVEKHLNSDLVTITFTRLTWESPGSSESDSEK